MKPIKLKLLKRPWSDDEYEPKIPLKKRIKERAEKENEETEYKILSPSTKSKRGGKILENSSASNAKNENKIQLSDDDSDSEALDEMFSQLKKSGFKTIPTIKTSPKSDAESGKVNSSSKKSSSRKNSESEAPLTPSQNHKKTKRGLLKELEDLKSGQNSPKSEKKSSNFVLELEKLPEDVILNYKRTPVKNSKYDIYETPKKETRVETPLRRSSRRRSSILLSEVILEDEIFDFQKTPVRKNDRTPNKRPSSVKKYETPEPKTPKRRSSSSVMKLETPEPKTPKRRSSSVKKLETPEPKTPRTKIVEKQPSTPLEKARFSLHVSTVPESLPCREKEYNNILNFLENKLWDGIGGCMYISGVPGTGKTATVSQVIRHLQECAREGKVPEFKYIELNGMRLADPRQAYVQLWQKLFDKKEKITPDRAQKLLDDWFSKSDRQNTRKTTVLLVDELDLICTKKQDVVYNLLDWPTRTHSRLVVLTIANTMDMPERLFKGRVTSRMGLTRLTFMPYTHKQLEEIVLARLNGLNAFVTDAVRLVTRKVAAVSGDARRALDICRRATELPAPEETVKISHIEQAIKEMTNSNIVKVLRNCGEVEKLFLRSLSDVSSRSNLEEVDLREVIDQILAVCVLEGIPRPSISSILSVSNRLKCCRLIFANQTNAGILQRLTLNVTQDDIHYALRT